MVNLTFRLTAKGPSDKQSPPSKTLQKCCIFTQNCKQAAFDMYIVKTGKIINNSTLEKQNGRQTIVNQIRLFFRQQRVQFTLSFNGFR